MAKGIFPGKGKGRPKRAMVKYNWVAIKRDFLYDPTMTISQLAQKHNVPLHTLQVKSRNEKWPILRDEILHGVQERMAKDAEDQLVEIKSRHLKIARLMQKLGLEALENEDYKPKDSKEARAFLVEGIRIEKELAGLEKKQAPAIVNIITEQEKIIQQYTQPIEDGEIVSDGEE